MSSDSVAARRVSMTSMYHTRHVRAARSLLLGFLFLAAVPVLADSASVSDRELIPDTSLPIPQLHFDSAGALAIQASATSSEHDFDYLVGNWKLQNRKLKSRLTHSDEW